ncbi:extracellular solute-binding protein [Alteribacillus sp. HJP-4]|uniref:extracellular solute-binding protein n=1 Tax=Alteribacillus sp. HJP-4 TaxID=2775394 RepID=UPI0035CCEE8F
MKKLTWTVMLMLAAIMLLMAACGPDREEESGADSGGSGSGGEEPEKPESLTVWVNNNDEQSAAYEEIAEGFTEEHGIEVKFNRMDLDEQIENVSLDGPNGNGPDLFFAVHDGIGEITLQGLAAPLEIEEERLEEYEEEAIQAMTYEEELYGVPAVTETYALMYNKELMEEAPETLEDLEVAAEDLTDASNDEYSFLMEAANFYFTYPFMTAEGGYVFNQKENGEYDASDIGLDNKGAIEGASMIQSWYENGYIPQGINADILNGLFEDGKVGAVVNGPWAINDYANAIGEENLGVAPLPTNEAGENLRTFSGVKGWLVSQFAEDNSKYWGTELALHMTNADSSKTYYEVSSEVPAITEVIESDLIQEDEYFAGFAEQTQYSEPMPSIPEMAQVWDPMGEAHEYIAEGEDPAEVLPEAVEQIESEIQMQQ